MKVIRKGFIGVQKDNDLQYLNMLENCINVIDPFAGLEATKTSTELKFRICLSAPKKFEQLIQKLNVLHTQIGIHTDYSKSMKKTSVLYYTLTQE